MPQRGVRGRTIFLTGATGEIGGELLRRFLSAGAERVYCLVRPHPTGPVQRLKARIGLAPDAELDPRVVPVPGDMAAAGLGIAPQWLPRLRAEVELVFHCAAITSFIKGRECWATNVAGLRHLLALTRDCERRPRLYYFGSSSAVGDLRDACVHETDYPRAGAGHFAQYSATKAAAETVLLEEGADLDIVILRPSMVLPDTPVTQEILRECIWPLRIMREISILPLNADAMIDVVPLSFVGEFTLRIASAGIRHRCYHISAGRDSSTRFGDVVDMVSQTCERPITCVQGDAWRAARRTLSRREIVMIRSVSPYFPFINQNVTFDNERLVSEIGAPPPGTLDMRRYLPGLLNELTLEEAMVQSRFD